MAPPRRAISWALTGAVITVLTSCSTSTKHASKVDLLPVSAHPPISISTRVFAPTGLGAQVTLPADWKAIPQTSDVQYAMRGPGSTFDFLLATQRTGVVEVSPNQLEKSRSNGLRKLGADLKTATIGTVDGQPAVELSYTASSPAGAVSETEYDIFAKPTTLAVGASQHQSIYSEVTIVLGGPASNPDSALLNWIASTIRLAP